MAFTGRWYREVVQGGGAGRWCREVVQGGGAGRWYREGGCIVEVDCNDLVLCWCYLGTGRVAVLVGGCFVL